LEHVHVWHAYSNLRRAAIPLACDGEPPGSGDGEQQISGSSTNLPSELYHPSAPTHQSGPCARAVVGVAAASARDSTTLPPASTAAESPHPPLGHLPIPSVPSSASAQIARPPPRCISTAPAAAPSAEISPRTRDATVVPRCDASAPQRLPLDIASTAASPAGSSCAAAAPRSEALESQTVILNVKSILGFASGRHGFQPIQFTEYFLPSLRIFLGCEPSLEVLVIGENVPTQRVRNRLSARRAQQVCVGLTKRRRLFGSARTSPALSTAARGHPSASTVERRNACVLESKSSPLSKVRKSVAVPPAVRALGGTYTCSVFLSTKSTHWSSIGRRVKLREQVSCCLTLDTVKGKHRGYCVSTSSGALGAKRPTATRRPHRGVDQQAIPTHMKCSLNSVSMCLKVVDTPEQRETAGRFQKDYWGKGLKCRPLPQTPSSARRCKNPKAQTIWQAVPSAAVSH